LEINFKLPKSHQFVESLVLIAPKSKNNKNEEKSDRNTKTKKKNKNFENDKTFNKMTSGLFYCYFYNKNRKIG